jgi:hypothetical protein
MVICVLLAAQVGRTATSGPSWRRWGIRSWKPVANANGSVARQQSGRAHARPLQSNSFVGVGHPDHFPDLWTSGRTSDFFTAC